MTKSWKIENLNRPVTSKETESVIKISTKKNSGFSGFTAEIHHLKTTKNTPPLTLPYSCQNLPFNQHVYKVQFSSVQFSRSAMSDSLWPHGLQHARLLCPSPIPGACSNSCPSSWWCHQTILSSVVPFSSCLQTFLASGFSLMSQFFTSGGQRIGRNGTPLQYSCLENPMDGRAW